MKIQSLLKDLSKDKYTASNALNKLQELIQIDNDLMCELLSAKTNTPWHVITISGQEFKKAYSRYIFRYGLAFINEEHADFNKIKTTSSKEPIYKPATFAYIKPNKDLMYSPTDKIFTDKNFILCNYGTAISATEKYSYMNKAKNRNWLLDILAQKGYITNQPTLSKFNSPEQVDLIMSILDDYFSRLLSNQKEMESN